MGFGTESELLQTFIGSMSGEWPTIGDPLHTFMAVEPKGLFGIPDLVVSMIEYQPEGPRISQTLAFEMKLSKWNRALVQAFRYRSFANASYVVLDSAHIRSALQNIDEFARVNVGLLGVSASGEIYCHHVPYFDSPYSDRLAHVLATKIYSHFSEWATSPWGDMRMFCDQCSQQAWDEGGWHQLTRHVDPRRSYQMQETTP